jgi:hypothetical protein
MSGLVSQVSEVSDPPLLTPSSLFPEYSGIREGEVGDGKPLTSLTSLTGGWLW